MKRKYICIPVMVLMICALFPGMMVSGDCESCSTENVTPYTPEDLKEFSLEADVMLDMLSRTIVEKVDLLKAMLEDPPSEKDEELTQLINDIYDDYVYYLLYTNRKAITDTVTDMTTAKEGYLIISKTEIVSDHEIEMSELHLESYMRSLTLRYDTLRSYYDSPIKGQTDYSELVDEIISIYDKFANTIVTYATLVTKREITSQAERQEILTRDDPECDDPGAGDSLVSGTWYTMSNFRWVKAWVGVYSTQSPIPDYIYTQYCTTTQRTLLQHLAYANDTYGPWNVGSLQVKYFFLADEGTHQHNAIYEGNISNYNLNGEYLVGDDMIEFTNGIAWTYGVPYDGYSTPSYGSYKFTLYLNYFLIRDACCTPSASPDDTTYDQWCNRHCYSCFACDDGGDQNFILGAP